MEAIRVLLVGHTSTKQALQKVDGRLRSLIITAPEALRIELSPLSPTARAATAARLRPSDDPADVTSATKTVLRLLAHQRQLLAQDLKALKEQLEALTTTANPGLRQVPGVGPVVAATLLVTAGDNPERMTSEAAFAALCGASPVQASSGQTSAMRLNRGGHSHATAPSTCIAIVRLSRHHQPTIDYMTRRTAEGKSKRAILRCLKRFIAREVYQHLVNPQPAVRTDDLRARREAISQPMRVVADAIGVGLAEVSRLERGTNHDPDLATRYRTWIQQQEAAS